LERKDAKKKEKKRAITSHGIKEGVLVILQIERPQKQQRRGQRDQKKEGKKIPLKSQTTLSRGGGEDDVTCCKTVTKKKMKINHILPEL